MPISSRRIAPGARLPWFSLTDLNGKVHVPPSDAPSLIVFLCNHSPYVQHIQRDGALARVMHHAEESGFFVLGISSNDTRSYPTDDEDSMRRQAATYNFTFPYCLDTDQEVAKAFGASCTPEFFLYDAAARLAYHGQFDGSRPGNGVEVSGRSLEDAITAIIEHGSLHEAQHEAFGCSIKWRSGNEPDYLFAPSSPDWLLTV